MAVAQEASPEICEWEAHHHLVYREAGGLAFCVVGDPASCAEDEDEGEEAGGRASCVEDDGAGSGKREAGGRDGVGRDDEVVAKEGAGKYGFRGCGSRGGGASDFRGEGTSVGICDGVSGDDV